FCGVGGSIFDFVLHLAEFVFKLIGGTTKFRHTFAEGACKFWELLGTEHDERQSQNQKQLGHADAEHEHKLFDFMLLIKLSTIAQLPLSLSARSLQPWRLAVLQRGGPGGRFWVWLVRRLWVVPGFWKMDPGRFIPENTDGIRVCL